MTIVLPDPPRPRTPVSRVRRARDAGPNLGLRPFAGGKNVRVTGNADVLVEAIASRLKARRIASAESCTGGLLAQVFAKAGGSIDWFPGGVVTYQKDAKVALLGLEPGPVVTHAAARAMAAGAAKLFDAEIAVSITCAAGPDALDGAAPGTVFVGTFVDGEARSHRHHVPGSPDVVCQGARDAALADLLRDLWEPPMRDRSTLRHRAAPCTPRSTSRAT